MNRDGAADWDEPSDGRKEAQQCRLSAMNLLARREHSCRELQRKLISKGFPGQVVEAVVEALQGERLLSDLRFAEAYVNGRMNKGYGPLRIAQELRERGVDDEQAAEPLAGQAWLALAARVLQKRFGERAPADDYKAQARQMRFLQYRGFTPEQIRSVMNSEEWNEWL